MTKSRPNIVFITTDQHRADCYSFIRPDIRTPHIDALRARGSWFSRCYCPAPLCQPARASILTGLLPHTHGVRDNGIDIPDDMIEYGFPHQAQKLGYKTAMLGKAHLATQHTFKRTGRPECRHTMADYYDNWNGPYMGFDHVELFVDGPVKWPHWEPPHGLHYSKWLFVDGQEAGKAKNTSYYDGHRPESGAQQTHSSELPLVWHTSSWLGDRVTKYISEQSDNDPFSLWISFPDPHHPFDAPEPWNKMYDPNDVDLPKHRDLDLGRRPWWHEASMKGTPQTTEEFKKIRETLSRQRGLSDRQLREITASYFGMISLVDHQVGRIVAALHQKNMMDNTLIIVASDHGEFLGDHGLLFKGPMMYDSLVRVGMIAAGPGVPMGHTVDDVVSTMDVTPTVIDYCGGQPSSAYHGQSLRPYFEGKDVDRDHVQIEWGLDASRCGIDLDLRTAITKEHRYTVERGSGDGELYNLKQDPYEMDNLFNNPASSEIIKEMEVRLSSRPDDERKEPLPIVGMC